MLEGAACASRGWRRHLPGGGLGVGDAVLQRCLHRQLVPRVLLGVPLEGLVGGGL